MIPIRGPTSLVHIDDPDLRDLVALRMSQLADGEHYDPDRHGELYVADPTDTAESLEEATGVSIVRNPFDDLRFGHPDFVPTHEFVEERATCFELGFVLSDEGAVAIFVPKNRRIDAQLMSYCLIYAVPAAAPPK